MFDPRDLIGPTGPQPSEYGLANSDFERYLKRSNRIGRFGVFALQALLTVSILFAAYVAFKGAGIGSAIAAFFSVCVVGGTAGVAALMLWIMVSTPFIRDDGLDKRVDSFVRARFDHQEELKRQALLASAVKGALADYPGIRAKEFWRALSGPEFERALAGLFVQLGYRADLTPASGDSGIDIYLAKDGRRIIVQCKAHAAPVGPAVVRELYGTLTHHGADEAILASVGGFTQGVFDFVRGKPIQLLDLEGIVEMVRKSNQHESIDKRDS